jgi:D-alanine-D-alanine ligase
MAQTNKTTKKSTGRTKPSISQNCFIGPVETLEDYVQPDWWQRIFNSLYLKTDADVVDDPFITCQEVDTFSKILNLSLEDKILDLCCGHGRHVLELARRGFKVEGLDRSRHLIQKARAISKKENLSVKFREGDARKLPYGNDTFDVVMIMGNSFGYFETEQDDLRVLNEISRVLKPWGRMLLDVSDGEYLEKHFQARSWEWIDKKLFVCRERSLSSDSKRLISREVITDVNQGVIADQFYAERLYQKEDLLRLFKEAGFVDAAVHGEIITDSQRNQDLGMMERRIIVTGTVIKDWTPKRSYRKGSKKRIDVIFGDPKRPDFLKPHAVFDDDDFYTISQLKSALSCLSEYEFTYISNHHTIIQDLKRIAGKTHIAMNLCDEGFNNDPSKELHIPALLDILNIPYTGASSQCLAFCYDKSLVRGIAKEMKIPVPRAFFIEPDDTSFNLPFCFPVIVKPNLGDS